MFSDKGILKIALIYLGKSKWFVPFEGCTVNYRHQHTPFQQIHLSVGTRVQLTLHHPLPVLEYLWSS